MKAALYRNVFKFLVKQSAETIAQSESGRLFRALGAATACSVFYAIHIHMSNRLKSYVSIEAFLARV